MSYIQNNSIFWVEVDKVRPNPYQPRREFDQDKLNDLAESIKMYGLLQPLTVTRQEMEKEDGGLMTVYELISGERRLRASKIAGLIQVPVIIRSGEENDQVKLELAIIENLQREDLNPVERAQAFQQLVEHFSFTHQEIAKRVGKSREYVSNTIRILALPKEVLEALAGGKLSEGHARPILMLKDKPQEQITLFKEVVFKKLNVRESEAIARRIAYDKIRKQSRAYDPDLVEIEDKLAESLGTRVMIEKKNVGGKIMIDFFSSEDLYKLVSVLEAKNVGMSNIHDFVQATEEANEDNKSDKAEEVMADLLQIEKTEDEILSDDSNKTEEALKSTLEEALMDNLENNNSSQFEAKSEESRFDNISRKFSIPSYSDNNTFGSKGESKDNPMTSFGI